MTKLEERLNKFLANNGICSRRKADEYIAKGRVCVNGKIVTEMGYKVAVDDVVVVDQKVVEAKLKKVYIKLNKPTGYVSTSKEQFGRPCVLDLVKESIRLYPVGRLDMYSEGLILLTNDGELVNRVIHPTSHVSKTYEVTLTKEILDNDIDKLKNGVDIGGYVTKHAIVKRIARDKVEIVLFEGKNRQIRKMCETLGYKIQRLKRTKIGKLELGHLKSGKYEVISIEEINKIFEPNR